MSAEEIKFPPAERRTSRQFEVPPWERDKFEELQQRRAAEQAARAAEAVEEVQAEAPEAVPGETPASPEERPAAPGEDWADSAQGAFGEARQGAASVAGGGVDDRVADAMLAELAAEEESGAKSVKVVNIASGAVLAVIGCVLIIWGVAAFVAARRAGAVGVFGGIVLLMFGIGFVAGGVWIGTKNLR